MAVHPSGEQFAIRCGETRAVVVEVGGGLRTFQVGGVDVLDGYGEQEMCDGGRGQMLLPWPNRIRDGRYAFGGNNLQLPLTEPARHNAIHGLVRWQNWSAIRHGESEVTVRHRLYPSPGYPFSLDLAIRYQVSDGELITTTWATNVGPEPCPFGAGAHPYLSASSEVVDSARLLVPAESYLRVDEQMIPLAPEPVAGSDLDFRRGHAIGSAALDVAYTDLDRDSDGRASVTLQSQNSSLRLELWMDVSYRYVMIFTGDTLHPASRRRHGLAVEPMTCAPNAFASGEGFRVIDPGDTAEMSWGLRVRSGGVVSRAFSEG